MLRVLAPVLIYLYLYLRYPYPSGSSTRWAVSFISPSPDVNHEDITHIWVWIVMSLNCCFKGVVGCGWRAYRVKVGKREV